MFYEGTHLLGPATIEKGTFQQTDILQGHFRTAGYHTRLCQSHEGTGALVLFLDPKTFEGFKAGHRAVQETWAFLSDYWDRTIGNGDNPALGATAQYMGDVFILMPKWAFSVFVHEAFHATHEALRIMNTDDEEFGAYIIEWLYERMYWAIHDKTDKGDKQT